MHEPSSTFPSNGLAAALLLAAFGLGACGGENNAVDCDRGIPLVPCSEKDKDEAAREALDDGDYDTAITLYEELVAEEPENYQQYTLLAAAYAARAGFSIVSIVLSGSEGGDGVVGQLSAFLPDPADLGSEAYLIAVGDMAAAVARLTAIPEALRSSESEEPYATSAQMQLMLYQTAYSIMYLNQFVVSPSTGSFDPALLDGMTEADALVVIDNLAAAGALQADNPQLQAKIDKALTDIDGQAGSTSRDRLAAYIQSEQGS